MIRYLRALLTALLLFEAGSIVAATGSWNGMGATAINGVAQTSWNGTGISCASATELELITAWPGSPTTITQDNLGYTFTPSANITVTKIGHRRHGSQTDTITVELRVWSGNGVTGTLLATGSGINLSTVSNGQCAYVSITPVSLTSGTKYYLTHPAGSSAEDQYSSGATTKPDLSQQNGVYGGPNEDTGQTYYAEHNLMYTKP